MRKGAAHDNDPFSHPRFIEAGKRLNALFHAVPDLKWPTDLYGDNVTIAELMAEDYPTPKIGKVTLPIKCACGCGRLHKNAASTTVTDTVNGMRMHRVVWYCVGHRPIDRAGRR